MKEKNIVQDFTPLEKQKAFMYRVLEDEKAKFTWYVGGFGSGKSYVGSQTAIRLAMQAPNGRGLIGRSTLVDLKATTKKTFMEVCDPRLIAKKNNQENMIEMINGHEIYFWGLDDIEKLKSFEIGWFWIDEVDQINPKVFEVLMGRIRNKHQPKRCGMVTSNSEGKNWTYKLFIEGKLSSGDKMKKDKADRFYTIKAPSTENVHLPEDYIETLHTYTGDLFARYVNASFDVFEGQIFREFDRAKHVIKPFAIPEDWEKIRGIDHGERNPTAVGWYAISPDKQFVFKFREYYQRGKSVKDHAKEVAKLSEGEYNEYTVIDPSVKSTRGVTGKKIDVEWKEEMRKYEPEFRLRYGVNSVNAGIARMHTYLHVNKEAKHPITKALGSPRFFIFDTCTTSIDELEGYKWTKESRTSEDDPLEKPRKRDDHSVDETRYVLMSRANSEVASVHNPNSNIDKLLAIKPSKRDQVFPITDDEIIDNMRKQNPDDFLI